MASVGDSMNLSIWIDHVIELICRLISRIIKLVKIKSGSLIYWIFNNNIVILSYCWRIFHRLIDDIHDHIEIQRCLEHRISVTDLMRSHNCMHLNRNVTQIYQKQLNGKHLRILFIFLSTSWSRWWLQFDFGKM